ncbi:ParB/RepB/Spo0J family partition protein [Streptomyces sp. H10-C2]|uniref:ParB/RepB/Spo0J family partition protein n=1 Tax=unclassified Streptomyces TaxID=2593676 RepID=UPI0024B9AF63|nr:MULTISPECIES: ParB/RepB/Spo0J family partition protein [unclassified Streptomyces]MDJ0340215.1 ParB/RepB/Spo0J family partition protein [Streptomyces sp. PH10-H1]MDJ0368336.1 ParB/RepB/Spo0J family partition protein [Streptomyces sp. H10-C2]
MSDRRRGLGRGLGALIPAAPSTAGTSPSAVPILTADRSMLAATKVAGLVDRRTHDAPPVVEIPVSRETEPDLPAEAPPAPSAYFAELPIDSITPNSRQPREVFDEDALNELITSIKEVGLLQPVVVRQSGAERYELIMGERRWRACREAGLENIPAIVRATDDEKLLLDALLENLHRAQLNPLEEAAAYDQLLRDFACTHEQLADRIGRSRSQVSNTLRLLKLSAPVQRRVAAGVISFGHARALLSLEDGEDQDLLAHRIVAEGLSVRAVEEIVTLMNAEPKSAKKAAGPRAGRRVSPALTNLATRLSDRFDTRVKVDLGQKRGKIVVEFASIEDLERILGTMAPGEGKVLESRLDEESDDDVE